MHSRLTATEARVAGLVADGRSDQEIAATLALGAAAVEEYVARACEKLGIQSRTELAMMLAAPDRVIDPADRRDAPR